MATARRQPLMPAPINFARPLAGIPMDKTDTSPRAYWDGHREALLATLHAHPDRTRNWLELNYPAEEEGDRPTLDDLSSDDLALAVCELEDEGAA